ncbi:hypothetical protein DPMN_095542 [Dreissena polymorpha]|uniref:Uncharacterized protein n=1 Tax=Dreissena polymorpha TaxID=45954 RepID=A0A9D4R2Z1_DREPO|nr:hypothetical protein DPMN_095542 [Dreissena polymorpha]
MGGGVGDEALESVQTHERLRADSERLAALEHSRHICNTDAVGFTMIEVSAPTNQGQHFPLLYRWYFSFK